MPQKRKTQKRNYAKMQKRKARRTRFRRSMMLVGGYQGIHSMEDWYNLKQNKNYRFSLCKPGSTFTYKDNNNEDKITTCLDTDLVPNNRQMIIDMIDKELNPDPDVVFKTYQLNYMLPYPSTRVKE